LQSFSCLVTATVDSGYSESAYSELSVIVNYFRGPFKNPYHLNTKNSGYSELRLYIMPKIFTKKVHYNRSGLKKKFTITGVTPDIVNSGYSEPISPVPWEFTLTGVNFR